ncbi:MAG: hypothetical protein HC915_10595, partial [Anaerolineae bacterium]|nr:hypothetical protein [Anaerolineae bacterium]
MLNKLRQLYSQRDNTEDPAIQMTRAALAYQYRRGQLYDQAIAELQAALAELPDRADLKVSLAETYLAHTCLKMQESWRFPCSKPCRIVFSAGDHGALVAFAQAVPE